MLRHALLLACVLLPEFAKAGWEPPRASEMGYVPLRVGSVWGVRAPQRLSLWYRFYPSRPPDLTLQYFNGKAAPFEVGVRATYLHDPSERRAILCLKRRMGPTFASVSLEGLESERELMQLGMAAPTPLSPRWARRFGPRVTLGLFQGRETVDGELLHGVRAVAGLRVWPDAMGNRDTGFDARGQIEMAVPLPGDPQHRLLLGGRWRRVWDQDKPLLRTGGTLGAWQSSQRDAGGRVAVLSEGLRGYEDQSWYTRSVATVEVSQRLPVNPRMELEWFFNGAYTRGDGDEQSEVAVRRVAGTAVRLRTRVANTPVTVAYQAAYRIDEREPWLHLITASL
jgi:hypothetical protein